MGLRGFKTTTPRRDTFTSSASSIVSLRNRIYYAVLSDELVRILGHSTTERNVDDRSICPSIAEWALTSKMDVSDISTS
jgi:hypothetical protein